MISTTTMYTPNFINNTTVDGFNGQHIDPREPEVLKQECSEEKEFLFQMKRNLREESRIKQQIQLMNSLVQLAHSNTVQMLRINQKLFQNENNIECMRTDIQKCNTKHVQRIESIRRHIQSADDDSSKKNLGSRTSYDFLMEKIFGKKIYRYSFQLQQRLPKVLYKEKNFDVKVRLVDKSKQKIMNSNVIYLSFAVCDGDGEWINENKAGQMLMKGQTEVVLYHGEAVFRKMYSRQVSKKYKESRLNFVVYARPSTLKLSYDSICEKSVCPEQIEPLILRNICIMSKKN